MTFLGGGGGYLTSLGGGGGYLTFLGGGGGYFTSCKQLGTAQCPTQTIPTD